MIIFVNVHAGTIRSGDVSRVIAAGMRLLTVEVISNDSFFFKSSLTMIILRLINIKLHLRINCAFSFISSREIHKKFGCFVMPKLLQHRDDASVYVYLSLPRCAFILIVNWMGGEGCFPETSWDVGRTGSEASVFVLIIFDVCAAAWCMKTCCCQTFWCKDKVI